MKRYCMVAGLACASAFGTVSAAQANTEVMFCNKTGAKVFIAVAHFPERMQKWMMTAWHTANPGQCKSIGKLRTGLFYYYAEKEGRGYHWPARAGVDKTYCVPNQKVERVMMPGTCAPGERNLGFKGAVPGPGKYTVNLQ